MLSCQGWGGYKAVGAFVQDQRKLGSVGSDPRYAVAWKPPAQAAVTVLEDICCNIARTGAARLLSTC